MAQAAREWDSDGGHVERWVISAATARSQQRSPPAPAFETARHPCCPSSTGVLWRQAGRGGGSRGSGGCRRTGGGHASAGEMRVAARGATSWLRASRCGKLGGAGGVGGPASEGKGMSQAPGRVADTCRACMQIKLGVFHSGRAVAGVGVRVWRQRGWRPACQGRQALVRFSERATRPQVVSGLGL